jgi:hypothetical protein
MIVQISKIFASTILGEAQKFSFSLASSYPAARRLRIAARRFSRRDLIARRTRAAAAQRRRDACRRQGVGV